MRGRCAIWIVSVALLTLFGVEAARAQEGAITGVVIEVIEEEEPSDGVVVSAIANMGKRRLSETGSTGRTTVPFDLLNLGKGTPVTVYLVTCDGEREIVLVPEGEPDEECDRAREDPDCDCERLGIIYWGETTYLKIRITGDGATMETEQRTGTSGVPPSVLLGLKADAVIWTRLEDAVCDQLLLTACEADDLSVLFSPFVEVRLGSLPLSLGLAGSYAQAGFDQTFDASSDPSLPGMVHGEQDVWSLEGYGRLGWWVTPRVSPYFLLGLGWIWNSAEFESDFSTGTATEDRDADGARFRAGGGLDLLLFDGFGLRFNADYVGGGGDDADSQIRLGGGFFVPVH